MGWYFFKNNRCTLYAKKSFTFHLRDQWPSPSLLHYKTRFDFFLTISHVLSSDFDSKLYFSSRKFNGIPAILHFVFCTESIAVGEMWWTPLFFLLWAWNTNVLENGMNDFEHFKYNLPLRNIQDGDRGGETIEKFWSVKQDIMIFLKPSSFRLSAIICFVLDASTDRT